MTVVEVATITPVEYPYQMIGNVLLVIIILVIIRIIFITRARKIQRMREYEQMLDACLDKPLPKRWH